MDDLTLFIAIFASLAVILISLLFLKSKHSQQSSETKTGGRRRVAVVPNRDEDGQIVDVGPRGISSSILSNSIYLRNSVLLILKKNLKYF